MSTSGVIVLVVCLVSVDLMVVGALLNLCATQLRQLAAAFPATTPLPDAVRRNFQSFSLGLMNLGFSIHVAADAQFLHLTPVKFLRALGAPAMSIPWDAIKLEPTTRPGRATRKAMVQSTRIAGPAWCMELAGERPPPT